MSNRSTSNALAKLVVPEAVAVHLQASSKNGVLEELCNLLGKAGLVRDAQTVLQAVLIREKAGSTGCGLGVAVPHARLQGPDHTVMAIGLSKSGIDFGAIDGQPVKVFFLIVGPQNNPEAYLRLLSQVAQLIKDQEFRNALLDCESASSVMDLLRSF